MSRLILPFLQHILSETRYLMARSRGLKLHRHVDWRAMAGMRDRLIHGYLGVDYDIVWDVITTKVPTVQREVEQIVRNESTDR